MSEMTVEQAKDILTDVANRRIAADKKDVQAFDMAIKALEENDEIGKQLITADAAIDELKEENEQLNCKCEKAMNDLARISKEKADLEEEKKVVELKLKIMKDGSMKQLNTIMYYSKENEKLKEECKKYYDQMMEVEKNAQAEISRLNDENENLKKCLKVSHTQVDNAIKEIGQLNDQMSAVEVLEWLKRYNHNEHESIMKLLFDNDCICVVLDNFTSQEIVDKITEYEKSKATLDTNIGNNEIVSNADNFKVGEKVFYKNELCIIESIESEDKIGLVHENGLHFSNYVKPSELRHAEPPKEEPQVEWMCECYCDVNIFYCRDEEFAIRWCERKSKEIGTESYYRKVCRRKE